MITKDQALAKSNKANSIDRIAEEMLVRIFVLIESAAESGYWTVSINFNQELLLTETKVNWFSYEYVKTELCNYIISKLEDAGFTEVGVVPVHHNIAELVVCWEEDS